MSTRTTLHHPKCSASKVEVLIERFNLLQIGVAELEIRSLSIFKQAGRFHGFRNR